MTTKAASRFAEIDAELNTHKQQQRKQCRLCRFLDSADQADAQFIDGLVRNEDKSATHIARVLTAGGVEITESSVKRHRQQHLDR